MILVQLKNNTHLNYKIIQKAMTKIIIENIYNSKNDCLSLKTGTQCSVNEALMANYGDELHQIKDGFLY